MLVKTEGIVLHSMKYSESSVISHIYTKDYGVVSFIMNNVRGKRSKAAYFQPFAHIAIEAYKKDGTLSRIKEIKFASVFVNLYSDIAKSSITQFLGEFLYKLIHSEETHIELYTFILTQIQLLDTSINVSDFHIRFLIELMEYFGIAAENNYSIEKPYFNIQAACFETESGFNFVGLDESRFIHFLLSKTKCTMNKNEKALVIAHIINYYRTHLHDFGQLKSLEVLKAIFY